MLPPLTPQDRAADEDEEDRSLIRWMLTLDPGERLDVLDEHVAAVLELREINRNRWASESSSEN